MCVLAAGAVCVAAVPSDEHGSLPLLAKEGYQGVLYVCVWQAESLNVIQGQRRLFPDKQGYSFSVL